jgi:hypothetical protein
MPERESNEISLALATALGEEVPNVNASPQRRTLRKRR